MAYPEKIDQFTIKLNKKPDGNRYAIEEEVVPVDGIYEGELKHDNVVKDTVRVYTGSKMTGNRIDQFVLSVPSERPWRTIIKIFSDAPMLYISYETPGDTVEADDVNTLQDAITAGNGLTGGGQADTVTLHVGAGNGINVLADTVEVKAYRGITVDTNGVAVNIDGASIVYDAANGNRLMVAVIDGGTF